tara:strand:- start:162 stop:293 length:132 start_codon:yes stop_codon:yes gene_type:complete
MAEELSLDMVSAGRIKFVFKGFETDEKKIHLIMEVESMEKSKE